MLVECVIFWRFKLNLEAHGQWLKPFMAGLQQIVKSSFVDIEYWCNELVCNGWYFTLVQKEKFIMKTYINVQEDGLLWLTPFDFLHARCCWSKGSSNESSYRVLTLKKKKLACCIFHNYLIGADLDDRILHEVDEEISNDPKPHEQLGAQRERNNDDVAQGEILRNLIAIDMWRDYTSNPTWCYSKFNNCRQMFLVNLELYLCFNGLIVFRIVLLFNFPFMDLSFCIWYI